MKLINIISLTSKYNILDNKWIMKAVIFVSMEIRQIIHIMQIRLNNIH